MNDKEEKIITLELINELLKKTEPYWNPTPSPTHVVVIKKKEENPDE